MQKDLIPDRFHDIEKSRDLLHASVAKYVPYDAGHIYTADELKRHQAKKRQKNEYPPRIPPG